MTCHWVHLNWDHLFWSGATFLFLGSVCEILDKKKTYQTLVIAVVVIPATIWGGLPELKIYGGLSGLDCALYALLFALLLKREMRSSNRSWAVFYAVGLVALLAKVTYETTTGQTIFVANTHSGMIPVPLSHLAGGFVGFSVGIHRNIEGALDFPTVDRIDFFDRAGDTVAIDRLAMAHDVLGVIGPKRLNYARIIPMVDFTARVVSRMLT